MTINLDSLLVSTIVHPTASNDLARSSRLKQWPNRAKSLAAGPSWTETVLAFTKVKQKRAAGGKALIFLQFWRKQIIFFDTPFRVISLVP